MVNSNAAGRDNSPLSIRPPQPAKDAAPTARWYGVYTALVKDLVDPEHLGRIKIWLTWAPDSGGITGIEKGQQYEGWARISTLMAGANRGSWFLPEINDEVLVAFEGGDPSKPYVMGALWNGKDPPPAHPGLSGENNVKVIETRSGMQLRFTDEAGHEKLELTTPGGQKMKLSDESGGYIEIQSGGHTITVNSTGVKVETSSKIEIAASSLEVSAAAVNVTSGMSKFDGVVRCDTLIAKNVVAQTYSPGAGNLL